MTKSNKFFCFTIAILFGLIAGSQSASAYVYTLANDNGGDGYVVPTATGFDLFCSDVWLSSNTTTYLTTASTTGTIKFNYTYTTNDCCGPYFDPAGYVINGQFTQLSPDSAPYTDMNYVGSGTVQLSLVAGDVFGFYVSMIDGPQGRADIAVSTVPLPAALPLFGSALIGLAGLISRRKASV
jgi:hypothetical protein